jgi:hypothetical protein
MSAAVTDAVSPSLVNTKVWLRPPAQLAVAIGCVPRKLGVVNIRGR